MEHKVFCYLQLKNEGMVLPSPRNSFVTFRSIAQVAHVIDFAFDIIGNVFWKQCEFM